MWMGGGRLLEGGDPSDGAARTGLRTNPSWTRRRAVVGVPVPHGRPRLEARAAGRIRLRAGHAGGARARTRAASTGAADRAEAHARRARRGVPGAARRPAG